MQIDDIISVVIWASEQHSLDAQRIGLWGTSFGGCHVFGAAVKKRELNVLLVSWLLQTVNKIVTGKMNNEEKEAFLSTVEKIAEKHG